LDSAQQSSWRSWQPQKISDTLQFFIDLLAAVPSVIYGLLGVFIVIPLMREYLQPFLKKTLGFLPLFQGPAYGVGFFTRESSWPIMVIPYIISVFAGKSEATDLGVFPMTIVTAIVLQGARERQKIEPMMPVRRRDYHFQVDSSALEPSASAASR